jgi:phenylacetate-CoA ligase
MTTSKTLHDLFPVHDVKLMQEAFEMARSSSLFREYYVGYNHYEEAPAMGKNELKKILAAHFNLAHESKGVYLVRSGGSTQSPLIFPVDIHENQEMRRALARALVKHEIITPKTIALNIFGYADLYRTAAIMDDMLEKCEATTLAVSAHAAYEDMLATALHFKPGLMMGTPSKLLQFVKFLENNQQRLVIPDLLYAGEFLRPSLQTLFKKILGVKRIWSLYGSAETGIWAWASIGEAGSTFKVLPGVLVEILEPDEAGYGVIAVTNTYRKRFPVFRYLIGDIGRWQLDGEEYVLELKSRETKSFVLAEQHYDLEELNPITMDADAFQIQLSTQVNLQDEITILLVQQVEEKSRTQFLLDKNDLLARIILANPKLIKASVVLVEPGALYMDAATTKIPALVDWRE